MAADDTASFAIDFKLQGVTDVKAATASLADMRAAVMGDTEALKAMQATLRTLKGNPAQFGNEIKKLQANITAQKAVMASNAAGFLRAGGTMKEYSKLMRGAGKEQASWLEGVKSAPGPLGRYASALSQAGVSGLFAAAAGVAVIAVFLKLGAAVASAIGSLISFGVSSASARRDEQLHLEAITKLQWGWWGLYGAMGRVQHSGAFLQNQIDKVSSSVALGRDKVAGYAESLYKAGLRGGNLTRMLEGMSIVASTQGEEAANSFRAWGMGIAYTGGSVEKLTNHIKAKLGGIAKAQLLSLDVQTKKLRENFSMLFSGVKIEPILHAMNELSKLLSLQTESGKALKVIFETWFGSMEKNGDRIALMFKRFYQGAIIGALELTLQLMDLRDWLNKTFRGSWIDKWINDWNAFSIGLASMRIFVLLLGSAAVVAVVLAAALGVVAVILGLMVIGIAGVVVAFGALIYAIGWVVNFVVEQFQWLWSQAKDAGLNIARGIADGLSAGAHLVFDAMKGMAKGAWKSFKEKLGIASPSKLFRMGGVNIAQGVAQGVEAGKGSVADAVGGMTSPADMSTAPAAGGMQKGSNGTVVNVMPGAIVIGSTDAPQSEYNKLAQAFSTLLESVQVNMGAPA